MAKGSSTRTKHRDSYQGLISSNGEVVMQHYLPLFLQEKESFPSLFARVFPALP